MRGLTNRKKILPQAGNSHVRTQLKNDFFLFLYYNVPSYYVSQDFGRSVCYSEGRLTMQERWKIPSLFYDKKIFRKLFVTDLPEILKKFIFSPTENI